MTHKDLNWSEDYFFKLCRVCTQLVDEDHDAVSFGSEDVEAMDWMVVEPTNDKIINDKTVKRKLNRLESILKDLQLKNQRIFAKEKRRT